MVLVLLKQISSEEVLVRKPGTTTRIIQTVFNSYLILVGRASFSFPNRRTEFA
jgi:hypothetical protein